MSASADVAITLSAPDGTERTLSIAADATVGQLKALVQEQEPREVEIQRRSCDLIFQDKFLAEEEARLEDLGITDGALLTLVWKEQLDRAVVGSYQSKGSDSVNTITIEEGGKMIHVCRGETSRGQYSITADTPPQIEFRVMVMGAHHPVTRVVQTTEFSQSGFVLSGTEFELQN